MARPFSHPNLGNEVRVEQIGKEVSLTFVCGTFESANGLADDLLRQLKEGALNITLMGKPTSVEQA
jgi:hypothetical protein